MLTGMRDLLTIIGARRGEKYPEAAVRDDKADASWFRIMPLASAERALADGDFAGALNVADKWAENSARLGLNRSRIAAAELAIRALSGLERWDELLVRADAVLADAEQAGFRTRAWRILAERARARAARGDVDGAREDRTAARALLDGMAARIADPELRAAFEADPRVTEVRNA
jgi:hypothetical protein